MDRQLQRVEREAHTALRNNLTTLFSYTWSRALDENSAIRGTGSDFTLENQRCRSCDYGPAGYNIPHRFVTSILYAVPFGKGRQFLNQGGVLNQIVGGWQLSTITTVQSGTSINHRSWDSAGMGAGFPHSNRLNCVAGVNPVADNPTPDRYYVRESLSKYGRRRIRQLRPQQLARPFNLERRFLYDEGFPHQ